MKKKDVIYLVLAVGILLTAGYIAYTKLLTHKGPNAGVQVDVVGTIPANFNDTAINLIGDSTKVLDFYQPIDLTTGLNNPAPFGH